MASRTASLSPCSVWSMKSSPMKPMMAAGMVPRSRNQPSRRSAIEADVAVANAGQHRPHEPNPVAAEVDEQRDQRSKVQEYVEGEAADQGTRLPAEDPGRQLQVRAGADRDELGHPLDDPDHDRLEDEVHDHGDPSGAATVPRRTWLVL